jgi:hypothetical protein
MSEEKKATDQYLELYKLAVEMADRVSARRASLFTFPFTANTALFAVLFSGNLAVSVWIVAVIGLTITASWWVALQSYRTLTAAKFGVILEMEKNRNAQIFSDEWQYLKMDRPTGWRGRYLERGMVEGIILIALGLLYVTILVGAWF